MVVLLTCDCALLAVDILIHACKHIIQVMEERYLQSIEQLEGRDGMEIEIAAREKGHTKRIEVLESAVFFLELICCFFTMAHFLHIWYLHGFTFGLVDGVLALHLHTAYSSANKKLAQRRNLHKIARDLDALFFTATKLEIQKAHINNDVCCICLGTLSVGNIKKIGCGHLFHTNCLREVIERARSIEAAKCPFCRASVLDGRQTPIADDSSQAPPAPLQQQERREENPNERALFRFSTEGILPNWLPLPAFSFEVVRRPTPEQPQQRNEPSFWRRLLLLTGTIPMSPQEEADALEQLVDMFPQYDRGDLRRELRERGSAEGVAEIILMGLFAGQPIDGALSQEGRQDVASN